MREMGKAMMGTGEASGEGRAMAAAEAAIANPLLDETSMKGAKGLLISITGGRDLTLFEVDEAATRIREEVDQDANIILGATFDEELEGVIRVSVVATGIDKSAEQIAAAPIAIRAPQPQAKPAAPLRPVAAAPAAEQRPAAAPVHQAIYEPRAHDPVAEAIQLAEANAAEMAQARPAPAAHHDDDFRPVNKLFQAPPAQPQMPFAAAQQVVQHAAAVREAAQPVAAAPQRMPRVEDFPPQVKAEVEAKAHPLDHEDRGPMGLLKRLTNGLTRREEEPARLQPAQPREPRLRQVAPETRRLAAQDSQLYAPRRGQLDDHGRLATQTRAAQDDDQLEIPAFLRRQAN
jgi:cell division protein FtsZ